MSSKKKNVHTYIVLSRKTINGTSPIVTGRYKVGAKNTKDAENILRAVIGQSKVSTYYQQEQDELGYGEVVDDLMKQKLK